MQKINRVLIVIPLLLTGALLGGCATRSAVTQVSSNYWVQELNENALSGKSLSVQTAVYLELRGWDKKALRDGQQVVLTLRKQLIAEPDREGLVALSELAYRSGDKSKDTAEQTSFFLMAARAAYAALFDSEMGPPLDAMNPNLRFSADLYNHSVSRVVGLLMGPSGDELNLTMFDQTVNIKRDRDFSAANKPKGTLVAFDYKTDALRRHNHRRGIGVPVVTMQDRDRVVDGQDLVHPPVFDASITPYTVLLHFQTPWKETTARVCAQAEVVGAFSFTHIEIAGETVPLEADTSLALALVYSENAQYRGVKNMLRFLDGDFMGENRGLYLLEPYNPDCIPVVFTHGLMDSALTWVPMINELYADPEISKRYQFWAFFYPTGNPILQSAYELRKSLLTLRARKEAEGTAWDEMVLVGHSMGGLITRLLVTDSSHLFSNANQRVSEIADGDPELEAYLESLVTFDPLPYVQRAVFMAAPHRGATMAGHLSGRTGSALIDEPDYMNTFIEAGEGRADKLGHMENGIDNLAKDSFFSLALGDSAWASSIPVHSVIGDLWQAGGTDGSDGVVAYWSSHVDGAESELIIKADHLGVHKSPSSIAEIRRILHEHLDMPRVSN